MYEAGQDVAILHVEVVVGSEHVGRYDGREAAAVLLVVGPVLHVHQSLGVAVAEVGRVRRTVVNLEGGGGVVRDERGGEVSLTSNCTGCYRVPKFGSLHPVPVQPRDGRPGSAATRDNS